MDALPFRLEARERLSDERFGSDIQEQFDHEQRPQLLKNQRDRLIGRRKSSLACARRFC
jgi:hypothetical protein